MYWQSQLQRQSQESKICYLWTGLHHEQQSFWGAFERSISCCNRSKYLIFILFPIVLIYGYNVFSEKLSCYGFNFFPMLVIDLVHEFELGIWRALFIHLLRILNAENPVLVHTLDQQYVASYYLLRCLTHAWHRFRQVPTFGSNTIQQFANNISGLKKLAAHEFEDILQVSTPFSQNMCWIWRKYCDIVSFKMSQRMSSGLYNIYNGYMSADQYSDHVWHMST